MPGASAAQALSPLQCEWRYAASCKEALAAMEERHFRVVLSKSKLADGSGRRLIPAVLRASGWLFLSFPVERGCWWIPVIEAGRLPVKVSAVHSRQFRSAIVEILKTMESGKPQESTAEPAATSKIYVFAGQKPLAEQCEKIHDRRNTREGNPETRKIKPQYAVCQDALLP
jgi:hypothetical protein